MTIRESRKDAIALLKADHKTVRAMLAKLEKTTERAGDTRKTLLAKIELEIQRHTTIEEEIFYPAYREAATKKEDAKLYQEALEEHHVADTVLSEIKQCSTSSEVFSAKAKVLKELIEHHAEEEEKQMFPRAKRVLSADRLSELGGQMQARKKELIAADESWIPSPKELFKALAAKASLGGKSASRSRSHSVAAAGAAPKARKSTRAKASARTSAKSGKSGAKTARARKSGRTSR